MLKYLGVLIAVKDIAVARKFYEECLGQKVGLDLGVNVGFEAGFALHQKDHFQGLLGGEKYAASARPHWGELFFETNEIDGIEQRLKGAGVEFIHEIVEQPWAQRVMRFYDPDGHVLEIGETMEAVVVRLHQQGGTVESICQKTGMPQPFVEMALSTAP